MTDVSKDPAASVFRVENKDIRVRDASSVFVRFLSCLQHFATGRSPEVSCFSGLLPSGFQTDEHLDGSVTVNKFVLKYFNGSQLV
jgi:hypothetical protein